MDDCVMRERVGAARVARLATVGADGTPHLVPVCFALDRDRIVVAVDDVKPKSSRALRRLDNIRAHRRVALLVDHYDDDWSQLWWVRIDGNAAVVNDDRSAVALLAAKYEQYHLRPPPGPVIVIAAERWSSWP